MSSGVGSLALCSSIPNWRYLCRRAVRRCECFKNAFSKAISNSHPKPGGVMLQLAEGGREIGSGDGVFDDIVNVL